MTPSSVSPTTLSPVGRRRLGAATLVACGVLLAVVAAAVSDTPPGDTAALIAFATVGSLAAGAAVVGLGRLGHHDSLFARLVVVALVSTTATAAGVVLAAQAMFISAHDLGALGVVLAVAASLGGASAVVLSSRVAEEAAELSRLAQRLGPGEAPEPADVPRAEGSIRSVELRTVADELHRAHDRLDRERRRAEALDASRRELVAWVSHDLRSPIASVRAMAEALEDGVVEDRASVARYHRTIRTEAERLGSLVDDLFELSRIASGVAATATADLVLLDELLLEVIDAACGRAHARGIELAHRLADGDAPLVPRDLRRVLRNLVDNAISATSSGGRVVVVGRLRPATGDDATPAVTLDVIDECGGIDAEHLPRLFEVGYRIDAARRRDEGGGGLGLAIARGLLEAHDGHISVANDGPGCRFTVSLPLQDAS